MTIRVLIVDDAPDIRRMLQTALRLHGDFEVVAATGEGLAAIDLAGREQPDVVVLDLGLPDLEGRDVLTGLRARAPEAKVVVFTGRDSTEATAIAGDVEAFLLKDADLEHLVGLLAKLGAEGPAWTTLTLPGEPASVARARHLVRDECRARGRDGLIDAATLVASELVSNAIVHARSGCELRLRFGGGGLRIEVVDGGQGTPDPRTASADDEHGRGLQIVSGLSFAWGVVTLDGGRKSVWAELAGGELP